MGDFGKYLNLINQYISNTEYVNKIMSRDSVEKIRASPGHKGFVRDEAVARTVLLCDFSVPLLPLRRGRTLPTLGSVSFRVRPALRKEFCRARTPEHIICLAGATAASAKLGGGGLAATLS